MPGIQQKATILVNRLLQGSYYRLDVRGGWSRGRATSRLCGNHPRSGSSISHLGSYEKARRSVDAWHTFSLPRFIVGCARSVHRLAGVLVWFAISVSRTSACFASTHPEVDRPPVAPWFPPHDCISSVLLHPAIRHEMQPIDSSRRAPWCLSTS